VNAGRKRLTGRWLVYVDDGSSSSLVAKAGDSEPSA
jgi:hypothetical protein